MTDWTVNYVKGILLGIVNSEVVLACPLHDDWSIYRIPVGDIPIGYLASLPCGTQIEVQQEYKGVETRGKRIRELYDRQKLTNGG